MTQISVKIQMIGAARLNLKFVLLILLEVYLNLNNQYLYFEIQIRV